MRLASTANTLVRRCHHAESIEGGRHMPRVVFRKGLAPPSPSPLRERAKELNPISIIDRNHV